MFSVVHLFSTDTAPTQKDVKYHEMCPHPLSVTCEGCTIKARDPALCLPPTDTLALTMQRKVAFEDVPGFSYVRKEAARRSLRPAGMP